MFNRVDLCFYKQTMIYVIVDISCFQIMLNRRDVASLNVHIKVSSKAEFL